MQYRKYTHIERLGRDDSTASSMVPSTSVQKSMAPTVSFI